MSKIALKPNNLGTGTFTIEAPNSNTDRTINLPDDAGDMVLTTATQSFTNKSFDSAPIPTVDGTAPLYMCRAWVNFNGTGTVAIRASGNVSSITDNGTGDYTVNFTTAMQDTEYAAIFGGRATAGGRGGVIFGLDADTSVKTVSALRVRSSTLSSAGSDAAPQDADNFSVAIFE
jgi:hypothetical protein